MQVFSKLLIAWIVLVVVLVFSLAAVFVHFVVKYW
jgi:hypothetical protein